MRSSIGLARVKAKRIQSSYPRDHQRTQNVTAIIRGAWKIAQSNSAHPATAKPAVHGAAAAATSEEKSVPQD